MISTNLLAKLLFSENLESLSFLHNCFDEEKKRTLEFILHLFVTPLHSTIECLPSLHM